MIGAVMVFKRVPFELPSRFWTGVILALLVWPFLSLLWSGHVPTALLRALKWCVGGLVFFLAFQIPASKHRVWIGFTFSALLWVALAYALAEYVLSGKEWPLVGGLFRHPNLFASCMVLALFPLAGTFKKGTTPQWVHRWVLVAAVMTVLVLLQVRAAALALAVGAGAVAVLLLLHKDTRRLGIRLVLAGVVAAGLIAVALTQMEGVFNTASLQERQALWSNTGQLMAESPWLGVGAGQWQFTYAKFGLEDLSMVAQDITTFQSPHNDWLWIASELGLPYALAMVVGMVLLVVAVVRTRGKQSAEQWQAQACYLGTGVAAAVVACFSFPSDRIMHVVLLASVAAFVLKGVSRERMFPSAIWGVWLPLAAGMMAVGWAHCKGEWYTRKIITEKAAQRYDALPALCEQARSVFYQVDPMSTPMDSYEVLAYIGDPNAHATRLTLLTASWEIAPYDPEVLSNLGLEYMVGGRYVEAEEHLSTAVRLNPFHEPAWLNLAITHYRQGHIKRAQACLAHIPDAAQKYPEVVRVISR